MYSRICLTIGCVRSSLLTLLVPCNHALHTNTLAESCIPDVAFSSQNFVVLFSDGGANIRADDTVPEAISVRVAGARIITMSVGTQIDLLEMIAMASSPTIKNVMSTRSFNTMTDMVSDVVAATCNGTVIMSLCKLRRDIMMGNNQ